MPLIQSLAGALGHGRAPAIAGTGAVYSGVTLASDGSSDAFVVKYSTTGTALWALPITGAFSEQATAIVTDATNNFYVVGTYTSSPASVYNANGTLFTTLANPNKNSDCFIVKYNSSGIGQWAARIGGAPSETITAVDVDSTGNVFVTGGYGVGAMTVYSSDGTIFGSQNSIGTAYQDAYVVKYNSSGMAQWMVRIQGVGNSPETGLGIAADGNGNVIAGGAVGSTFTMYNSDGTTYGSTFATAISVAAGDAFITKYNAAGFVQWAAAVGGVGREAINDIVTDSVGNVYAVGVYSQTYGGNASFYDASAVLWGSLTSTSGAGGVFLVKYNSTGSIQWATRVWGGAAGNALAIDPSANLYVAATTGGGCVIYNSDGTTYATTAATVGGNEAVFIKYSSSGFAQWYTRLAGTLTEQGVGVCVDSNGNSYYTGYSYSTSVTVYNASGSAFTTMAINNGDGFVVKYDISGSPQWATKMGGSSTDQANGIAADSAGNVLVAGYYSSSPLVVYNPQSKFGVLTSSGTSDSFLVKYNTSGAAQWATRVSGSAGYSVATDLGANTYITGAYTGTTTIYNSDTTSFGTLTNSGTSNAYVVKYNASGSAQWATRIGGASTDFGYGIATDSSSNVFVTGSYTSSPVTIYNANATTFGTLTNAGGADAFLVKYNSSGNAQWAAKISSTTADSGNAVCTDPSGNVFVTGYYTSNPVSVYNSSGPSFGTLSNVSVGYNDWFIAKYNTSGNVLWDARITGAWNETGKGITADSAGNVYAVGWMGSSPTTFYNANGTSTQARSVTAGSDQWGCVKYNSSGFAQWIVSISSTTNSENGWATAVDPSGNVYFAGAAAATPYSIYDGSGALWGTITSTGAFDGAIVKCDTTGAILWVAQIQGASSDAPYGIVTDSQGNVFVTGYFSSAVLQFAALDGTTILNQLPNSGSNDAFIAKYNGAGTIQWSTRIAGAGSDQGQGISVDSTGNVYVGGYYLTSNVTIYNGQTRSSNVYAVGAQDALIAKYDTNGVPQWNAIMGGIGDDEAQAVASDAAGNFYVAGFFASPTMIIYNANRTTFGSLTNIAGNDGFVVKYDTAGFAKWAARISGAGTEMAYGVATDASGNVCVIGLYSTNPLTIYNADGTTWGTLTGAGNYDAFIIKYNSLGVVQWATRIAGTSWEYGQCIACDPSGNVIVGGWFYTSPAVAYSIAGSPSFSMPTNVGNYDGYVVKYSPSGVVQWVAKQGGTANDYTMGVASDPSGNIYATGYYGAGPFAVYNSSGPSFASTLANSAANDCFLVKYDSAGNVLWTTRVSATSQEYGYSVSTDASGNVYLAGQYNNTASVYNSDGTLYGTANVVTVGCTGFIIKYNPAGFVQWIGRTGCEYGIWPYGSMTDPSGNTYFTGYYGANRNVIVCSADGTFVASYSTLAVGDIIMVKYDTNGNVVWTNRLSGSAANHGNGIAVDSNGNVGIAGYFASGGFVAYSSGYGN